MTRVAAALVLLAAVVVAWPAPSGLRRLGPRTRAPRRRPSFEQLLVRAPRRLLALTSLAAAALALLTGGPVAAVLAGIYAALGAHMVTRMTRRRRAARQQLADLDALSSLAADLRAGAALPGAARQGHDSVGGASRLGAVLGAVQHLAERTGAPAADLLDRVESDARAGRRLQASTEAEAAGARMTAVVLAFMPLGGLGLGAVFGINPFDVLLRTPVGAACAVGAAALHTAGLLWSERITHGRERSTGAFRLAVGREVLS
ncbi:type II secretion system F family protein [Symbioplanes lichenis]|uniref:type II secretion system F family protein n=1 Tax=Symbioplanes lichenis TaxID=1629072 RepID=UPI00273A1327|nr:hypothetical protein [Actinoplanes lichenis]